VEATTDRKKLTTTQAIGEVWFTMLTQTKGLHLLKDIEWGIEWEAIREWGPGTRVKFDREKRVILVNKNGAYKLLSWGEE
jgi:hypothetical protein